MPTFGGIEESNYQFQANEQQFQVQITPKPSTSCYEIKVTKVGGEQDALTQELQQQFQKAVSSQKFEEADVKTAFSALKGVTNIRSVVAQATAQVGVRILIGAQAAAAMPNPNLLPQFAKPQPLAATPGAFPATHAADQKPLAATAGALSAAGPPADDIFSQMETDLMALKNKITQAEFERAMLTIKDLKAIEANFPAIQAKPSDEARKNFINEVCRQHGGGGVESNLSSKDVANRLELFKTTYAAAKQQEPDKLKQFYSSFAAGGACAENRMDNLFIFSASLKGIDVRALPDPEKYFFLPTKIFLEPMISMIDEGGLSRENSMGANRAALAKHLLDNLQDFAKEFEAAGPKAKDFLEYLELEGLCDKNTAEELLKEAADRNPNANWETVLTNFIRSPSFTNVFNSVWQVALQSY